MIFKALKNSLKFNCSDKYIKFAILNFLFLIGFFTVHIFHHNFLVKQAIMMMIIVDLFFSCVITTLLIKKFSLINNFVIFSSAVSSSLLAMLYGVLIPVMIDRSITVNMFLMMRSAGNDGVLLKDLEFNNFQDTVFDKRFNEMSKSGVIQIKNNKAKLTFKGKIISTFFYINKYVLKQ